MKVAAKKAMSRNRFTQGIVEGCLGEMEDAMLQARKPVRPLHRPAGNLRPYSDSHYRL